MENECYSLEQEQILSKIPEQKKNIKIYHPNRPTTPTKLPSQKRQSPISQMQINEK